MTEEGGEPDRHHPAIDVRQPLRREQRDGDQSRDGRLGRVEHQSEEPHRLPGDPADVGGADVARAGLAHVDAGHGAAEDDAEGNGSEQVGAGDEEHLPQRVNGHGAPPAAARPGARGPARGRTKSQAQLRSRATTAAAASQRAARGPSEGKGAPAAARARSSAA